MCEDLFVAGRARLYHFARPGDLDRAIATMPDAFAAADLTNADAAFAVIDTIESRLGAIDIIVNCAGAAKRIPPNELTPLQWRNAIDAKFFSYINVIDPLVKRMAQRRSGVIVSVIGAAARSRRLFIWREVGRPEKQMNSLVIPPA